MPITIKRDSNNVVVATATNMNVTPANIDVQNAGLHYEDAPPGFVVGEVYRITRGPSTYRVRYAGSAGLGSAAQRFSRPQ